MMETGNLTGRCTCGALSYRLTQVPMFVQCCHCTWCQRETGSAFAVNAMIETACLAISGTPQMVTLDSASGKGQRVLRCADCGTAIASHYGAAGDAIVFVRVGTLDNPAACPPAIHVHTASRLPWVVLGDDRPAVPGYYNPREVWPPEAQARFKALRAHNP
ncbi:GFA family protein [Paracoccus sp. p3-h83]|uniref:GFA family protein n=1 Tax=Paracoccus sp. p3-h83 TaxID=3342805 RepID=UPI0035B6C333